MYRRRCHSLAIFQPVLGAPPQSRCRGAVPRNGGILRSGRCHTTAFSPETSGLLSTDLTCQCQDVRQTARRVKESPSERKPSAEGVSKGVLPRSEGMASPKGPLCGGPSDLTPCVLRVTISGDSRSNRETSSRVLFLCPGQQKQRTYP